MKILCHSQGGDLNGLALKFKEEGHQVWIYLENDHPLDFLEGMVDRVSSLTEGVSKKPDFILFEMSGHGGTADRLIRSGLNVVGANSYADQMELKREIGMDLMRNYGIKIPETKVFKTIVEAVSYVKKNPKAYAVKVDGNKGAASSFVAKDDKEMIEYLLYLNESGEMKDGTKFLLQEKVDGIEISTEVWFSKGKPIQPFNSTFESKKFFPGDLGGNTGCETSSVFSYRTSHPKIVEKTIEKIFPLMERLKWTGPLDINCIVSEKDHEPYGLEWTPRLGYSAIYALAAMIGDGIAESFYGIATGKIDRIPLKHSWTTSLRLSIPPYPFEDPDEPKVEEHLYEKTKGLWIKHPADKNLWLIDAMKDKKGRTVTSGMNGLICECTGQGQTLVEAWKKSKGVFDSVQVANKMGRYIDGMDRAYKDSKKIRSWGYTDVLDPSGEFQSQPPTTPSPLQPQPR